MAVMDRFINAKLPLTIGIVDNNFGLKFDPLSTLVPYLRNKLTTGYLEVAFHSPDHIQITTFNLSTQQAQLKQGQDNLYGPNSKLPENPHPMVTFIPPFNFFDGNTLIAMRNLSYTVLSSSNDPNEALAEGFNFYDGCSVTTGLINSIYHWPEGAATADDGGAALNASDTITLLRQQLADCNSYSVVMLHFIEFADNATGNPSPSQLAQLDLILAEVNSSGCEVRFLRTLSDPYKGTPSAAPTPLTPFPTSAPTGPTKAPTAPTTAPTPAPAGTPTAAPINATNTTGLNSSLPLAPTAAPTGSSNIVVSSVLLACIIAFVML
jgi:hypothetical protein